MKKAVLIVALIAILLIAFMINREPKTQMGPRDHFHDVVRVDEDLTIERQYDGRTLKIKEKVTSSRGA